MNEINFVDCTFRDAQASLWGEKMNTAMMCEIASKMNQAGFSAMDATAISHFEYAVRYLRENPWERMRFLAKKISSTPLSLMMLGNSLTLFRITSGPIMHLWMERLAANGIKRVQLMESSNNMEDIETGVKAAKNAGLEVAIGLVYSHSPVHTDEYYAQRTADAAALHPDVIYMKDSGGLLTPERTRTVIPAMQENLQGLPFEFHSHCTTGLAPLCYLEGMKLGVKTFHTATRPLANGASQPSTEFLVRNARHMGYTTNLDEEAVNSISEYFTMVAKAEGLPIGTPLEYDSYQFEHQVPGGVIANLKRQLDQIGFADRVEEVLEETISVRRELGYPIMVTPFSQFAVAQASMNVIQGERYKTITDEIIKFALGHYGKQILPVDEELMDRINSLSRTKELLNWQPEVVTVEDLRSNFGSHLSEDELLLGVLVPEEDLNAMRQAGPINTKYSSIRQPLASFVKELAKVSKSHYIHMQAQDFTLTIRKTNESPDD